MDEQLTETLLEYLRGELPAAEVTTIERRLLDDEQLRRQLLELSIEESALADWAKSERASISLEEKVFEDEAPPSGPSSKIEVFNKPWLVAAAAILIVGFTAIAFSFKAPDPALVKEVAIQGVARLVASVDAGWQGEAPKQSQALPVGSYHLTQGSIDLAFADGAKVKLSGPATFTLKSARHIHLNEGNLVAQIPDEALGFIVTSPQSEVIDLGTEFGLSVNDSGQTDVHVLDGLVEVFPLVNPGTQPGVMLAEGEARRFHGPSSPSNKIPVTSREELLGHDLGLQMLRGSVRIIDQLAVEDFRKKTSGRNWIDLIAEQRDVKLSDPLTVSIKASGSHRNFETISAELSPDQPLDSYLLHFRPSNLDQVRGVIRFDQPIVAILCTGDHLHQSDALFGITSVAYPKAENPFRGLEPNGRATAKNVHKTDPDWQPDELVLSQDRHTLSIRTFANTERGYDQIRILTKAKPQD